MHQELHRDVEVGGEFLEALEGAFELIVGIKAGRTQVTGPPAVRPLDSLAQTNSWVDRPRTCAPREWSEVPAPDRAVRSIGRPPIGYGDLSPVTVEGRCIAVAMMVCGIALLGTVIATIASSLVERVAADEEAAQGHAGSSEGLAEKMDRLETLLVAVSAGPGGVAPGGGRPGAVGKEPAN